MVLKYLERDNIDDNQGDRVIENAVNGMPYAYTWYLDCVASKKWGALTTKNYEFVMPLPWNTKWFGLRQVYQPAFAQQLRIFGTVKPSKDVISVFLEHLPRFSRYTAINLNEANAEEMDKTFGIRRTNMLLDLNNSYDQIRNGYRASLQRRIERAKDPLILNIDQLSSQEVVELYRHHIGPKVGLRTKDYQVILQLMDEVLLNNKGVIYSVVEESETLASIFFLKSHGRLIQLFGSATARGKQLDATHFLLDRIIRTNCNTNLYLDFEGSELPGVASFFKGFGPQSVKYAHLVMDNFPFWLKTLRKVVRR